MIGAVALTGVSSVDFDGRIRPAAKRPDVGPYQSGAQAVWPWTYYLYRQKNHDHTVAPL
jgi:hypothetical protein